MPLNNVFGGSVVNSHVADASKSPNFIENLEEAKFHFICALKFESCVQICLPHNFLIFIRFNLEILRQIPCTTGEVSKSSDAL